MIDTREYQEVGIATLLKRKRMLLADAPGLGKTYQSTETVERANAFPCLVLCPAHLVPQWAEFIKAQYPHRVVSFTKKTDFYIRDWMLTQTADFYVANLEMLRQVDFYAWPKCKSLIFDESHHLKNRNSKQSQGALKLVFRLKPEYVFCLSATPIKREADDLFGQLRLLRPDLFTSYNTFVELFCEFEKTHWDLKVLGIKNKGMLMQLLDLVMLRREYAEVSMQLPELLEGIIPIEFDEKQRRAYNTLRDNLILRVEVEGIEENIPYMWAIQAINMLRRLTATNEKIDTCVALALDAAKPVVFTHYKATAQRIADALKVPAITGDVPATQRAELAHAQNIVVATIESLTEGVDLSSFDTVIFAEEDYTPGNNYQALSRVRRFGADVNQPIVRYCVHVKDSIDERIHEIYTRREATAGQIYGELEESAARSLIKDILGLERVHA